MLFLQSDMMDINSCNCQKSIVKEAGNTADYICEMDQLIRIDLLDLLKNSGKSPIDKGFYISPLHLI